MSDDRKEGWAAGTEQALAEAGPLHIERPRQEQLPLASTAPEPEAETAPANGARSAGRPAGSPNKRTAEIRDYLLANYPHPLIGLCEIYSRPTKTLAEELDCSPIEALKAQEHAALGVLPYLEAKMPQAVDVNAKGSLTLVLEGVTATKTHQVGGDGAMVIEAEVVDVPGDDENQ